ncbi:MAG: nucleotide-binding protein, partial [Prevotellaceae bacterium]|nr:nucleotide-binding protein [Candidatus Colivivens equi]
LINHMKGDIEKIELIPCMYKESENQILDNKLLPSKKVFIVHGHDEGTRNKVELFVHQIGYEPVILCKRADMGNTIIEKIEREAKDVCFAIVIYTYCDDGRAKEENEFNHRARQNVVFEHGFMCSHLGRNRVCALLEKGVEQPGDLQGVIYKILDDGGLWQFAIAKEMQAAGLQVNMNHIS